MAISAPQGAGQNPAYRPSDALSFIDAGAELSAQICVRSVLGMQPELEELRVVLARCGRRRMQQLSLRLRDERRLEEQTWYDY